MASYKAEYQEYLSPQLLEVLAAKKIPELYPSQWRAIKKGLEGGNLLISIPTASGKTLIAEILALHQLLSANELSAKHLKNLNQEKPQKRGKILYLCPLKALAAEKYQEFKPFWNSLGLKVGIATGEVDQPDFHVFRNDLIIITNEKADSLLRLEPKRVEELSMVICDEIHLINDADRGITLEFLITRLKTINSSIQIIGLSATIQNANQMADWMNATLISDTWRPVELKEGFYLKEEVQFNDGTTRKIPIIPGHDEVTSLTIDMLKEGGQILIFTNSRKSAVKLAEILAPKIRLISSHEDRKGYEDLEAEFEQKYADDTDTSDILKKTLNCGVTFHHAGLTQPQLNFLVDQYNNHRIKVICCTPTLAAGVNTPARRVIIKSLYRYTADKGSILIPIMEYKQMAGRAGRPRYDPYGEVIILGNNPERLMSDAISFIQGEPEKVLSKLADEQQIQSHILSLIVSKYASSVNTITQFMQNTFYFHQLSCGEFDSDIKTQSNSLLTQKIKAKQKYTRPLKQNKGGRGRDPLNLESRSDNLFTTANEVWKDTNSDPILENKSQTDSQQFHKSVLTDQIKSILHHFQTYDIVQIQEESNNSYNASAFGKIITQSYLSPQDAILIKEDLIYAQVLKQNQEIQLNAVSWVHLITKLRACRKFYLRKPDYNPILTFIELNSESFIMEEVFDINSDHFQEFAQEIKATMILVDWISEVHEKEIAERYQIGVGDLYRLVDVAQWLCRAVHLISKLISDKSITSELEILNLRLSHGIKPILIPFVQLKGIGRVRACKLVQFGIKTIQELEAAPLEDLAKIPLIGEKLAQNLKSQLLHPVPKTQKSYHDNLPLNEKEPKKKTKKPSQKNGSHTLDTFFK